MTEAATIPTDALGASRSRVTRFQVHLDAERITHPPMTLGYGRFSNALRKFVWKSPHHGLGIVQTVYQFAAALPAGTRLLDAGAGSAPYRTLFSHCQYISLDASRVTSVGAVATVEALPFQAGSFDAILCTEVLEHVAQPSNVLAEFVRVLAPGGHLCVTVPFLLGIHADADYYRFTEQGLRRLIEGSGLRVHTLAPRFGFPMATWGLLWLFAVWARRSRPPGPALPAIIRWPIAALAYLSALVTFLPFRLLDPFDPQKYFTVGYSLHASKPHPVLSGDDVS